MTQLLPARGNYIPSKQDSLSVLDEKWRWLELNSIIDYETDLLFKNQKDSLESFPEDEKVGRGQNLRRTFRQSPDSGGGRPSLRLMQEHLEEESSYNKGLEIQKLREFRCSPWSQRTVSNSTLNASTCDSG